MEKLPESKYSTVTCEAPVNIAVIKYWGKRDDKLLLPLNDSLSVTLNIDEMCARTTITASEHFQQNKMVLNGQEVSMENERVKQCLAEIKSYAQLHGTVGPNILQWCIHISSVNNFPTAAGLASSAAGYACLVFALSKLYGVEGEISRFARQGSGSACRSVYGGFVEWQKGESKDGHDSIAMQLAPAHHWPGLHVLILVVKSSKKDVGSTSGMSLTLQTSQLIAQRLAEIPAKMAKMRMAIVNRDFESFAELAMRDSNQFHAVCLDTFPPLFYLNETSREIINFVHKYNELKGSAKLAYTFDAGPNAILFLQDSEVKEVSYLVRRLFMPMTQTNGRGFFGIATDLTGYELDEDLAAGFVPNSSANCLEYVIHTKVGTGPRVIESFQDFD